MHCLRACDQMLVLSPSGAKLRLERRGGEEGRTVMASGYAFFFYFCERQPGGDVNRYVGSCCNDYYRLSCGADGDGRTLVVARHLHPSKAVGCRLAVGGSDGPLTCIRSGRIDRDGLDVAGSLAWLAVALVRPPRQAFMPDGGSPGPAAGAATMPGGRVGAGESAGREARTAVGQGTSGVEVTVRGLGVYSAGKVDPRLRSFVAMPAACRLLRAALTFCSRKTWLGRGLGREAGVT